MYALQHRSLPTIELDPSGPTRVDSYVVRRRIKTDHFEGFRPCRTSLARRHLVEGHLQTESFLEVKDVASSPAAEKHVGHSRLATRLRMLKRLSANHDREGASAPIGQSVDAALAFLPQIVFSSTIGATLNDDGWAVFEFEDRQTGFFADLAFHGEDPAMIDVYRRVRGQPSADISGELNDPGVKAFLKDTGIIA